jgi:ubiquinone/menaquinone biosynthesis C-methylase UbiE
MGCCFDCIGICIEEDVICDCCSGVGDLANESLQAQQENSQTVIDQQPQMEQNLPVQFE